MVSRSGSSVKAITQCVFEAGQEVGCDKWRFAAPAHHPFSTFPDGEPELEASWSHPTFVTCSSMTGWRDAPGSGKPPFKHIPFRGLLQRQCAPATQPREKDVGNIDSTLH